MTNKLPEKLSVLRKSFSFAQMDVASKIGVPVSEYMKWENGNSVCGIEISADGRTEYRNALWNTQD